MWICLMARSAAWPERRFTLRLRQMPLRRLPSDDQVKACKGVLSIEIRCNKVTDFLIPSAGN